MTAGYGKGPHPSRAQKQCRPWLVKNALCRLFLSVLLVDKVFKGGEEFPSEPPQSLSDFLHSRLRLRLLGCDVKGLAEISWSDMLKAQQCSCSIRRLRSRQRAAFVVPVLRYHNLV